MLLLTLPSGSLLVAAVVGTLGFATPGFDTGVEGFGTPAVLADAGRAFGVPAAEGSAFVAGTLFCASPAGFTAVFAPPVGPSAAMDVLTPLP